MNKYLIIILTLFVGLTNCKDKCKDQPEGCSGMYELREGKCQCPVNTVDMGRSFCMPFSENNFWIQEGDPCLGQAYLFFGKTGKDIFDEGQETIELEWSQGFKAATLRDNVKIDKINNQYYLINNTFNDVDISTNDFKDCIGKDYGYYDMIIKIDLDWTTANVTYKFWNDIDTSIYIKKEFGKELNAVFKSNTGPK
jgi:hypothetical protein